MREFYTDMGVRQYVNPDDMDVLDELAQAGDPVACYKLAKVDLAYRFEQDSVDTAYGLLKKAQAGGVVEADVEIALMYFRGEIEPYNPKEGERLLMSALEKKNEYAAYVYLMNLIFGRYGYSVEIDLADRTLDALMAQSDNPYWFRLKGDTQLAMNNIREAEEWYKKAVDGGVVDAYSDLAIVRGLDDGGEIADWDVYTSTIEEGADKGDMLSLHFMTLNLCSAYDEIDPDDKEERDSCRESIIECLECCNIDMSYKLLGDIHREGRYGVTVDYLKAWEYYEKGARFNMASCYEKMHDMLRCKEVTGENSEETMYVYALLGARLQSKRMIVETVEAYKRGHLTQFAAEIEMYHIPAYNAIPDDEELDDDEDELPDDDGRYDAWA